MFIAASFTTAKIWKQPKCPSIDEWIKKMWYIHIREKKKMEVLVTQLCLTFCDPKDYNLPGSSVHGILQARILEWVAITFSRGSSQPRHRTQVSHIAGRFFTIWATREAPSFLQLCHQLLRINSFSSMFTTHKQNM